MYLKCLELHGFKSFPNRTVLTFEKGTTVVVGPNGSGKSNISDAMRWVLGEISSRNIRGTKMEDVIFSGTNSRRQMGFAEVSVTFDNSDKNHRIDSPYEEITVTRRYFRAGESEYMINRKPCRLRDIHELFMNTGVGREGYSIIGQGRVAELISKKSEERRNVFEEAAGIAKYRHRKEDAERKLSNTEANMLRVQDIVQELESRVGPLEKEAEKAKKYMEVFEEKKSVDVALWLYDVERVRKDLETAENNFKLSSNELQIITQTLEDLERQQATLENETSMNRLRSEELLGKMNRTTQRLHELDNRYQVVINEIAHLSEAIAACKARIDTVHAQQISLREEKDEQTAKRSELEKLGKSLADERLVALADQEKCSAEIADFDRKLEELFAKLTEIDNSAVDYRARIEVLRSASESDGGKTNTIALEIEKYEKNAISLEAEAKRCDDAASGFRTKINETQDKITVLSDELSLLEADRDQIKEELNSAYVKQNTTLESAKSLERMEEHFQGYNGGVRFVMQEYDNRNISGAGTIYGPVSQLIKMDPEYVVAIETALGNNLQNIVVDTDDTARAAIELLKKNRAGRATFLAVGTIRSSGETEEIRASANYTGYIGRADRLVKFDPKFKEIVGWFLARTVVFDTLEHALTASHALRSRVRIVTLDGQVVSVGGPISGGSTKADSGILSRTTDIARLREDAKKQGEVIAKLEKKLSDAERKLSDVRQEIKDQEQNVDLLYSMSRAQFSALDNANAKLEANRNLLEKMRADHEALLDSRVRSEEELRQLEKRLAQAESDSARLREERAQLSITRNAADDRRSELIEKANDIFVRITEVRKDIEATEQMNESISRRNADFEAEIDAQKQLIGQYEEKGLGLETEREQNRQNYTAVESELDDLHGNRSGVESDTQEYEKRLSELRQRIKIKSNDKELCYKMNITNENKVGELTTERDRLASRLWDDYEITYEAAVALDYPPVVKENRSEFAARQTSLRARLRGLGSVNVNAIEEYRELKERYDALNTQYTDLKTSYQDLLNIIEQLETEMKRTFVAVFEQINENFKVVFRELFGGGSAELSLTDPSDVLTTGIEIKAAPPGKIIKNLALLSGGEQTFVAIALFFSILKVNPTPFCILDEIEAALDEVNVYRLGEYIKKFCAETQFILITHRRGTMEIADRLYGVTMPERGISKIIALDINEIESKQKELLDGVL
jgi:chromosome segregation protein